MATEFKRLTELAQVFLKLGILGFGGPAVHIAIMEEEVVTRRQWLTRSQFLDLLGATNLIPGPNSTEMVIHIGYSYGGWLGLWVAGTCFILPAVLMTTIFAWLYLAWGNLPTFTPILTGNQKSSAPRGGVWKTFCSQTLGFHCKLIFSAPRGGELHPNYY
jgi:chromate transporter